MISFSFNFIIVGIDVISFR